MQQDDDCVERDGEVEAEIEIEIWRRGAAGGAPSMRPRPLRAALAAQLGGAPALLRVVDMQLGCAEGPATLLVARRESAGKQQRDLPAQGFLAQEQIPE